MRYRSRRAAVRRRLERLPRLRGRAGFTSLVGGRVIVLSTPIRVAARTRSFETLVAPKVLRGTVPHLGFDQGMKTRHVRDRIFARKALQRRSDAGEIAATVRAPLRKVRQHLRARDPRE